MDAAVAIEDLKIVLVDDDEIIRHSLDFYFRKKRVPFLTFATAEDALQHIRQNHTDLIISDYSLPGMNGLQFIGEVNQFATDVGKIMITGYGSLEVAVEAMRLGVHDFIQKPLSAKTIDAAIHLLIEKKRNGVKKVSLNGCKLDMLTDSPCREWMELTIFKASHQINNSLLSILGNAELGQRILDPHHTVSRNLQGIVRGVQDLTHANSELMNLCRKPNDHKASVSISGIIRECVAKFCHEAEKNNIDVLFDDGGTRHTIKAERKSLCHIIENILINAIQELSATTRPNKQITIAVEGTTSIKSIVVTDNGNGIAPPILGKLALQRFTTKGEGHGFGLYIVKSLAEELGGSLDIKCEPSRGTRVEIRIPFETQRSNNL